MRKITCILSILVVFSTLSAQNDNRQKPAEGDRRRESVFNTAVPSHQFDVVLARPTANSVTLSLLFYENQKATVEYWTATDKKKKNTTAECRANEPVELTLNGLTANAKYWYAIKNASGKMLTTAPCHFHTQRANTAPFTFTMTADSHLDENADNDVYKNTLLNAAGDSADFHFDLGDTFMTDKYRRNYRDALNQYIAQRYYLGLLCKSSPLFFVQGNHDGESGQRLDGGEDNMTVWSNLTRKKYFPNPLPDKFYSRNTTEVSPVGLPQNYYSFQWGNALFVVLDPFWFTPRAGNNDPWQRTLGKQQYEWLKQTLADSRADFKFIFIHNLVGGADLKGIARGGAEVASLYEWGGKNRDGSEGFRANRPGWEMPIHELLKKYHVSAVFHGHDHIFAHQEMDGIVYQCLPQPGSKEWGNTRNGEEYGYSNGKILNGPGYLRIVVSQNKAQVEYVGTDHPDTAKNKKVIYQYLIQK